VLDLPDPEPAEHEVTGSGCTRPAVNPTDTVMRTGAAAARFNGRQATVRAGDGRGRRGRAARLRVEDRLRVGQRVIALVVPYGPRGGAYAERIVVPAASVVPAPEARTSRPPPPC